MGKAKPDLVAQLKELTDKLKQASGDTVYEYAWKVHLLKKKLEWEEDKKAAESSKSEAERYEEKKELPSDSESVSTAPTKKVRKAWVVKPKAPKEKVQEDIAADSEPHGFDKVPKKVPYSTGLV